MAQKIQTEWNLKLIGFDSDNDPGIEKEQKEIEKRVHSFVKKWKKNSNYLKSKKAMKGALDDFEKFHALGSILGKSGFYLHLREALEQDNPAIKAKISILTDKITKLSNELTFFTLSISKLPKKDQGKFLKAKELQDYNHFLKGLFETGKHTLSEAEEKILNLKSQGSYDNWVKMINEFLSKEEREVLQENGEIKKMATSQIGGLLTSTKKEVRDSAAHALNDIYRKISDSAEAELNSVLLNKKIDDELRGFQYALESRFLEDDMDREVVEALVEACTEKFWIANKHYALKSALLGLPKLEYHERNVPIQSKEGRIPFEESIVIVEKVLKGLNQGFENFFNEMLENGQIDVYPRKGKSSGGFCAHEHNSPVFILLNDYGRIRDTTTIAHEFGHALNAKLIHENQHSLNEHNPMSVAEVASTFFEKLTFESVLNDQKNDNDRLELLVTKLDEDVAQVFRQIACHSFQIELHSEFRNKGFLSKDDIGKLFQKHMAAYMGDNVEQSPGSENWWIYWGHIRSYFYNYQYSSGALLAKAMIQLLQQDPKFIEKINYFLSAGSSTSPKNIFKKMGIDISKKEFWEEGLKDSENTLNEAITLAKKLGKIPTDWK